MKRTIVCLLLAAMLLALAIPALAYESNPEGVIVGGEAYVFENNPPLFGESPIGTIPNGATVAVSRTSGDYRYVFFGGAWGAMLQGWVDRNQVRIVSPTQAPTFRPVPAPTARPTTQPRPGPTYNPGPNNPQGVVISETITLRQDPSVQAKKISSFKNGAVLSILGEQGGWYYVSYHQKGKAPLTGWVSGDYVAVNPAYLTVDNATYAYAIPDRSGKKVGQLAKGTTVLVICEYGDYLVINLRSASAFVYKRDVGW